jgi:hypothetical protein
MRLLDVPVYTFLVAPTDEYDVRRSLDRVLCARGGAYSIDAVRIFATRTPPRTTVALPPPWNGVEELARELSTELSGPVIMLESTFGGYWAYQLWVTGNQRDAFATMPAWVSWEPGSRKRLRGNAQAIAEAWPALTIPAVAPYLVHWDRAGAKLETRALPDDEFLAGSGWQMLDFCRRLGAPIERKQLFTW